MVLPALPVFAVLAVLGSLSGWLGVATRSRWMDSDYILSMRLTSNKYNR